jgi:leader peptidase (prepilin peptidase)/N-methyltransferase
MTAPNADARLEFDPYKYQMGPSPPLARRSEAGRMSWIAAVAIVIAAAPLGWLARRLTQRLVAAPPPPLGAMVGAAILMAAMACARAPGAGPAPAGVVLGFGLLTLAACDVAAMRLPNLVTYGLALVGLLVAATGLGAGRAGFFPGALVSSLIGAAAGYVALAGLAGLYRLGRGREGLGLGDAKLAACAGAWLGWRALPLVVLGACILAFAWVGVRWLRHGRAALREPLPFGAPLAASIWIAWLAQALWSG